MEPLSLALATETLTETEWRDTLSIGVVFTTGSVPELNPTRHGLCVPNLGLPIGAVDRRSSVLPARSLAVNNEQVV